MNIAGSARKMRNMLKEIFEIDTLLREFKSKKAEYLEALRTGTSQEALVRMEDELEELQRNIYARDHYTNPRRYINWN